MEKRFVTFLLISLIVLVGYQYLMVALFGPPPKRQAVVQQQVEEPAAPPVAGKEPADVVAELDSEPLPVGGPAALEKQADAPDSPGPEQSDKLDEPNADQAPNQAQLVANGPPLQYTALGSLDPKGPYPLLVVFTNQGAAIHSVEFSSPRYRALDGNRGYLGELALSETREGCLVQVVGEGCPAAKSGLRPPVFEQVNGQLEQTRSGDIITKINDLAVQIPADVEDALKETRPRQEIKIEILREGKPESLTVVLGQPPLRLLTVEGEDVLSDLPQPASYLTTICQLGTAKTRFGDDELKGLTSLYHRRWNVRPLSATDKTGPGVEFETTLSALELKQLGTQGPIKFVKRFRLSPSTPDTDRQHAEGYRLTFEIELTNQSGSAQQLAYQIDGPTGMTTEGWWYLYKTHPRRFAAAGARDVAWREANGPHELFVCGEITKNAKDKTDNPQLALTDSDKRIRMRYVGCDTQYFAAIMMPAESNPLSQQERKRNRRISVDR